MHPSDSGGVSRKHGCSVILLCFSWGYLQCLVVFVVQNPGANKTSKGSYSISLVSQGHISLGARAQFYCLWNRRFIHSPCSFADLCFQCEDQGLLLTLRSPRLGTYQPLELLGPKKSPFLQIPKAEKTNGSLWYPLAYKSPCWPPGSFSIISTCYNFQNP